MNSNDRPNTATALRFSAEHLELFATALLQRAGVEESIATVVADVLVEGDLLGHDTHGLQLLAPYIGDLDRGMMLGNGEPRVLAERASVTTWDGERLPGPLRVNLRSGELIEWRRAVGEDTRTELELTDQDGGRTIGGLHSRLQRSHVGGCRYHSELTLRLGQGFDIGAGDG